MPVRALRASVPCYCFPMPGSKPIAYGRVKGDVVELEHPVPELEGQRVRIEPSVPVVFAPEDPNMQVSSEQNAHLLREWQRGGPQGPISDEDAGLD